jgi:hypothetical protein
MRQLAENPWNPSASAATQQLRNEPCSAGLSAQPLSNVGDAGSIRVAE